MKIFKIIIALFTMVFMLNGCFTQEATSARLIDDYSFELNENGKDYSLRFALCDETGNYLDLSASVDIKIVNSMGETVYEGTKEFTKANFGYYKTQKNDKAYLADIKILKSDIKPGKAFDGKAYFTVYKKDGFKFEQTESEILYILPVKDFIITAVDLPMTAEYYTVYKKSMKVHSRFTITDFKFKVDDSTAPGVKFIVSGEKNIGVGEVGVDSFNYEVYDSTGKTVTYGNITLPPINEGEKFKNETVIVNGLIPEEKYTVKFFEVEENKYRFY